MQKPTPRDVFGYVVGILMVAFGMAMYAKSAMGTAVISSLAYVLSGKLTVFSFGVWTYLVQGLVMLAMIIIIRRVQADYLFSFASSVLVGYLIDFFLYCFRDIPVQALHMRIFLYAAAYVILTIGVGALMLTRLPIPPFDLFLREVSRHKNISIQTVKLRLDMIVLSIGLVLSLAIYGGLEGIGIGTFVAAITNGPTIQWMHKRWVRILETVPALRA